VYFLVSYCKFWLYWVYLLPKKITFESAILVWKLRYEEFQFYKVMNFFLKFIIKKFLVLNQIYFFKDLKCFCHTEFILNRTHFMKIRVFLSDSFCDRSLRIKSNFKVGLTTHKLSSNKLNDHNRPKNVKQNNLFKL